MTATRTPANAAAEALLGGLLIDGGAVERVARILRPEQLPTDRARLVFGAMVALQRRGVAVDYVTVADELEARGELDNVGIANLTGLINRCPTSLHVDFYARILAASGARPAARLAGLGI